MTRIIGTSIIRGKERGSSKRNGQKSGRRRGDTISESQRGDIFQKARRQQHEPWPEHRE